MTASAQASSGPAVISPPASPTTPTGDGAIPAPEIITFANNQQVVTLARGKSFLLQLDSALTWKVTVGDPRILVEQPATETGSQGRYQAAQIGETTLEAIGGPACLQANPPCRAPIMAFQLTVRVVET